MQDLIGETPVGGLLQLLGPAKKFLSLEKMVESSLLFLTLVT